MWPLLARKREKPKLTGGGDFRCGDPTFLSYNWGIFFGRPAQKHDGNSMIERLKGIGSETRLIGLWVAGVVARLSFTLVFWLLFWPFGTHIDVERLKIEF